MFWKNANLLTLVGPGLVRSGNPYPIVQVPRRRGPKTLPSARLFSFSQLMIRTSLPEFHGWF